MDDTSGNQADKRRLLDVEKQLYQRIVAKLNHSARDCPDFRYATSRLACAASAPNLRPNVLDGTCGEFPWHGRDFLSAVPELQCFADADRDSNKDSRRSTSGGVVTWRWSPPLLGGESAQYRIFELGEDLFSAITARTRSLGIQSELKVLGPVLSSLPPTVRASLITLGAVVTALRRSVWVVARGAHRGESCGHVPDRCPERGFASCDVSLPYSCVTVKTQWGPILGTGLCLSVNERNLGRSREAEAEGVC